MDLSENSTSITSEVIQTPETTQIPDTPTEMSIPEKLPGKSLPTFKKALPKLKTIGKAVLLTVQKPQRITVDVVKKYATEFLNLRNSVEKETTHLAKTGLAKAGTIYNLYTDIGLVPLPLAGVTVFGCSCAYSCWVIHSNFLDGVYRTTRYMIFLYENPSSWFLLGSAPVFLAGVLYKLRELENNYLFGKIVSKIILSMQPGMLPGQVKDEKVLELEKQADELEIEEKTNLLRITSDIGWSMILMPILTKTITSSGIWDKIITVVSDRFQLGVTVTPHKQFCLSFLAVLGLKSALRISVMRSLMPLKK